MTGLRLINLLRPGWGQAPGQSVATQVGSIPFDAGCRGHRLPALSTLRVPSVLSSGFQQRLCPNPPLPPGQGSVVRGRLAWMPTLGPSLRSRGTGPQQRDWQRIPSKTKTVLRLRWTPARRRANSLRTREQPEEDIGWLSKGGPVVEIMETVGRREVSREGGVGRHMDQLQVSRAWSLTLSLPNHIRLE